MSIEITHIRLSPGGTHESHITDVMWKNRADGKVGSSTTPAMVEFIDKGNLVYVGSGASQVQVGVVRPAQGPPYLRTHADGKWTNNLLALPRF